jgi:hypothetical protein
MKQGLESVAEFGGGVFSPDPLGFVSKIGRVFHVVVFLKRRQLF